MPVLFMLLMGMPALLALIDLSIYLSKGTRLFNYYGTRILNLITILCLPLIYVALFETSKNDCCGETATFSPGHQVSIFILVALCIIAFLYSNFKEHIGSPIAEVLSNCMMLIGLALNIFIALHIDDYLWIFGNAPIICILLIQLIKNHRMFIVSDVKDQVFNFSFASQIAWRILHLKPFIKYPVFLLLCLPLLTIIAGFLLLFGQKPDSMIRAFTDTYKHGFSQLNHECDNVNCGGHFLCSVAAKGHHGFVKPIRLGERGGEPIICNRQLLISNAFEELMEERVPRLHRIIRNRYNKVGHFIHRYYYIFNRPLVADFVYILMKPLEWLFLITLYTFDKKPENRIARQYISRHYRDLIDEKAE